MYEKELTIPSEVSLEIGGRKLKVSGPKGSLEKNLQIPKGMKIEKQGDKVKVSSALEERKNKAIVGTTLAHIRNAIEGVAKGYIYRLRTVYSHFPITVKVEGDKLLIQNFLGERIPRTAKIIPGVEVKVEGAEITVEGIDLEAVSQTAARIEQATRRTGYDKRVFQDGIWIVSKGE